MNLENIFHYNVELAIKKLMQLEMSLENQHIYHHAVVDAVYYGLYKNVFGLSDDYLQSICDGIYDSIKKTQFLPYASVVKVGYVYLFGGVQFYCKLNQPFKDVLVGCERIGNLKNSFSTVKEYLEPVYDDTVKHGMELYSKRIVDIVYRACKAIGQTDESLGGELSYTLSSHKTEINVVFDEKFTPVYKDGVYYYQKHEQNLLDKINHMVDGFYHYIENVKTVEVYLAPESKKCVKFILNQDLENFCLDNVIEKESYLNSYYRYVNLLITKIAGELVLNDNTLIDIIYDGWKIQYVYDKNVEVDCDLLLANVGDIDKVIQETVTVITSDENIITVGVTLSFWNQGLGINGYSGDLVTLYNSYYKALSKKEVKYERKIPYTCKLLHEKVFQNLYNVKFNDVSDSETISLKVFFDRDYTQHIDFANLVYGIDLGEKFDVELNDDYVKITVSNEVEVAVETYFKMLDDEPEIFTQYQLVGEQLVSVYFEHFKSVEAISNGDYEMVVTGYYDSVYDCDYIFTENKLPKIIADWYEGFEHTYTDKKHTLKLTGNLVKMEGKLKSASEDVAYFKKVADNIINDFNDRNTTPINLATWNINDIVPDLLKHKFDINLTDARVDHGFMYYVYDKHTPMALSYLRDVVPLFTTDMINHLAYIDMIASDVGCMITVQLNSDTETLKNSIVYNDDEYKQVIDSICDGVVTIRDEIVAKYNIPSQIANEISFLNDVYKLPHQVEVKEVVDNEPPVEIFTPVSDEIDNYEELVIMKNFNFNDNGFKVKKFNELFNNIQKILTDISLGFELTRQERIVYLCDVPRKVLDDVIQNLERAGIEFRFLCDGKDSFIIIDEIVK